MVTISRHRQLMAMGLLPQGLELELEQVLPQQVRQLAASDRDLRLVQGAAHQQRGCMWKHMRPQEPNSSHDDEA
ncbi:MAG: hypothetical protein WKF77_09045 [Planctomycetaceae bacterium]